MDGLFQLLPLLSINQGNHDHNNVNNNVIYVFNQYD